MHVVTTSRFTSASSGEARSVSMSWWASATASYVRRRSRAVGETTLTDASRHSSLVTNAPSPMTAPRPRRVPDAWRVEIDAHCPCSTT